MTQATDTTNESNGTNGTHSALRQSADLNKPHHPMELLLKVGSLSLLKEGDIVEGRVLDKNGTRLFVDLGAFKKGLY